MSLEIGNSITSKYLTFAPSVTAASSFQSIAKEYQVNRSVIEKICSGKIYKDCDGLIAGRDYRPFRVDQRGKHLNPRRRRLSKSQVKEMRVRRAEGESIYDLAYVFGVDRALVSRICAGERYADYGGPIAEVDYERFTAKERLIDTSHLVESRSCGDCGDELINGFCLFCD